MDTAPLHSGFGRADRRSRRRCWRSIPRPSGWRSASGGTVAPGCTSARAVQRPRFALIPAILGLLDDGRHRDRRPRRDRLRARPRRLHRPAHGVRGGAGAGLRRRQAGAGDRHPARPSPRTRTRAAAVGDGSGVGGPADARMDQIYAAQYERAGARWHVVDAPMLIDCETLVARWRAAPPRAVAGNALAAFAARLPTGAARPRSASAAPGAAALLRLAESAWQDGASGRAVRGAAALRSRQGRRDDARARRRARRARAGAMSACLAPVAPRPAPPCGR